MTTSPLRFAGLLLFLSLSNACPAEPDTPSRPLELLSPDGSNRLLLELNSAGRPIAYIFRGQHKLTTVRFGIHVNGSAFDDNLRVTDAQRNQVDQEYQIPIGKTSRARDLHHGLTVSLADCTDPARQFTLQFRAFNDGIAFRYLQNGPLSKKPKKRVVTDERTEFMFDRADTAWTLPLYGYTSSYESHYQVQRLSDVPVDRLLGVPMLLQHTSPAQAPVWIAVTEAGLTDYAGMYLSRVPNRKYTTFRSKLSPLPGRSDDAKVVVQGTLTTPWRVLMMGDRIGDLIESDLVFHLNEPSRISDPSWIRPGPTTFPWWNGYALQNVDFEPGVNTATMKYYIDFCAAHGIPYHSLDGLDIAWYGGPIQPAGPVDVTTAAPSIDLPELLRYANAKGVRLRLWMHWKALKPQLDEAFATFERWGIEGVMIDFMNRDDQEMVRWYHEVAEKAAQHRLTVTWHGAYKPTGMERTWPNVLSYEAVYNQEFNKWRPRGSGATPKHNVQVAFTRMLAGPLDYHQGGMRSVLPHAFEPQVQAPAVQGTRGHQLAMYIVYQNHLPMLVDTPSSYVDQPELPFLVDIPSTWDEIRVLHANVDRSIVVARRSGRQWYLGGMTAGTPERVELPLRFLAPGEHSAEIYQDNPSRGPTATVRTDADVRSDGTLQVTMPAYGGFAGRIRPVE